MKKTICTPICLFFLLSFFLSGCFNFDPLNLLSEVIVLPRSATSVEVRSYIVDSTGTITQYGHVWSEFSNPEIYRPSSFQTEFTPGSSSEQVISIISGLEPNKTYFVRAYMILNNDLNNPIYGPQAAFTTDGDIIKPDEIVNLLGVANITSTGAVLEAKIEKIAQGSQVISYGHCWSTDPNPDTNDFKTAFNGPINEGSFSSNLNGLTPGTKYYVRAYIITSKSGTEVIYSSGELDFATTNN